MQEPRISVSAASALVVVAGNVNYFYDRIGQRIAEALRDLRVDAQVATIRDLPPREFDCCFLINLAEIVAGHSDEADALRRLAALRYNCRFLAVWNFDSMATRWFSRTCNLLRRVDFDRFVDSNIHQQSHLVPAEFRPRYDFIGYALTRRERGQLARFRELRDAAERPIPWATIGHATDARVSLAHRLVSEVDPRGFVYLPPLSPVSQDGPHLNEAQYQAVLRRSRYHVWCAHHNALYLEGERYRASALTGGVPVKILFQPVPQDMDLPFANLLLPFENFTSHLREMDFFQVRDQFLAEFQSQPTLDSELSHFFRRVGIRGTFAQGPVNLFTE